MITLVWSNRFIKSVKRARKKHPDIVDQIGLTLEKLEIDPFQPSLRSHKLKGILAGCWACSVEYDYRIVFEIHKSENGTISEILLLTIGTHDEVY